MFDELSLLEADPIADEGLRSASSSLPAPDFTGSLDYIDSLASRSIVSISQRDLAMIATGISSFDYLSPVVKPVFGPHERAFSVSTDMRPLQDARYFNPHKRFEAPRALVRSSSRVVSTPSSRIRSQFPPGYRNPLDPDRSTEDLNDALRRIDRIGTRRNPFAYSRPNQVIDCLKRKARKAVLASLGFPSFRPWVKPRRNYWSRVIC